MQKLFDEVGSLDERCYKEFDLSEDILMEHAAEGMASFIRLKFKKKSKVIIVCGSGNNGADGIACARLLHKDYDVNIYYAKKPKSVMAKIQAKRADAIGVVETRKIKKCDVLVDAIVGTGFNGDFDKKLVKLIEKMNLLNAYKIACDIPSGYKFYADTTLTMGALKKELYLDQHKEFIGDIKVINLGVSREIYEDDSEWMLLDLEDLKLPNRDKKDTHKGSFGHLAIACGDKSGASVLSALSALRFGSGLVTLMGYKDIEVPYSIMLSHELPKNTTALALGMGLGDEFSKMELNKFLSNEYPLIIDADIFSQDILLGILKRKNLVLTPHPKEFVEVLKQTNLADISVEILQKNRFKYVELFCKKYPNSVLLLKGSNVIIAQKDKFFINPFGTQVLAKGGSGDILSGLIGSLLAQGYSSLNATVTASLAHVKLAINYSGADFSLIPDDLVNEICNL